MRYFWLPFAEIFRHRLLLTRLARHEFVARYRGSMLGWLWPVVTPVALMVIYAFVLQGVLAVRWPGQAGDDHAGFALRLMAGLVAFNLVAECLGRAPRLLLENPSYVKKLVFPVEVLPVVAMAGAVMTAAIGFAVLAFFRFVLLQGAPLGATLGAPLLLLPLALGTLGLCYGLAALGVFLRDTAQAIGPLLMALMFLSPVFYAPEQVPAPWNAWLAMNPLAAAIVWLRGALFDGTLPDAGAFLPQLLGGWSLLALGFAAFAKLRRGFADAL